MKGFSLNRIKELNKVSIFKKKDGERVSHFFEAYCSNGYSFNANIQLGDATSGISQLLRTDLGKVVGQQILGLSGGISMDRIVTFEGTSPYSITLHCFLTTDGDYEKNIARPINDLLTMILPASRDDLNYTEKIVSGVNSVGEMTGLSGTTIWNKINQGVKYLADWTGPVYALSVPPQLDKKGDNAHLELVFGNLDLEDVIISGVQITVPQFFQEDTEGSIYPDHVKLDITIETKRNAQTGLLKF